VSKRLSTLLVLVVGFLTVFAFTAGSGFAQTTGTSTAGTGAGATSPAGGTATTAATVAPTATRAATVAATSASGTTTGATAVATGTGGATVTTLPATGQPHGRSVNFLLIEAMVIGLAVIATGIALKRRAPRM
jgi:hypothetical protein